MVISQFQASAALLSDTRYPMTQKSTGTYSRCGNFVQRKKFPAPAWKWTTVSPLTSPQPITISKL